MRGSRRVSSAGLQQGQRARADARLAHSVRMSLRELERDYEKSEDDIKALQSVGQIIGEVLKQLDEERCTSLLALSALLLDIPY